MLSANLSKQSFVSRVQITLVGLVGVGLHCLRWRSWISYGWMEFDGVEGLSRGNSGISLLLSLETRNLEKWDYNCA